jgi:hypothetical protein
MYLFFDELKESKDLFPPTFYIFGLKDQPEKPEDFEKMLKKSEKIHKAANIRAKRLIKKLTGNSGKMNLVIHHPAYL